MVSSKLVLVCLFASIFFAGNGVVFSWDLPCDSPGNPPEFLGYAGWNWTVLERLFGWRSVLRSLTMFDGKIVFRGAQDDREALFSYDPSTGMLLECFATDWTICDFQVIDGMLYVVTGYASYPVYRGSVWSSADLVSWTLNASTDDMVPQSIGKYADGTFKLAGCWSDGQGTRTRIANLSEGLVTVIWTGSVWGSDDGLRITMFNETQMVVLDAYPVNVIYSNDGVSWTDSESVSTFDWPADAELRDGLLWIAAIPGTWRPDRAGLACWNGSAMVSYDLGRCPWALCDGYVSLSNEVLSFTTSPSSNASICSYNPDGSLGAKVLEIVCDGRIVGLARDPGGDLLYALAWVSFVEGQDALYLLRGALSLAIAEGRAVLAGLALATGAAHWVRSR